MPAWRPEDAAAAAENLLIGALGGENGALADVLAGGAVTSSAADVLATADGVGVADGSAGALRDRSGGGRVGGATDGLGGLARAGEGRAGAARTEGGALAETAPRGRFRASADDADESGAGSFDMQAVVRMINTRRAAITRCYETQLRSNPTLAGRVRVSMTIQESGSVTNVRAVENTTNSEEVASCVVRVVQGFRFNPGPTDGSVTYAFPFVFRACWLTVCHQVHEGCGPWPAPFVRSGVFFESRAGDIESRTPVRWRVNASPGGRIYPRHERLRAAVLVAPGGLDDSVDTQGVADILAPRSGEPSSGPLIAVWTEPLFRPPIRGAQRQRDQPQTTLPSGSARRTFRPYALSPTPSPSKCSASSIDRRGDPRDQGAQQRERAGRLARDRSRTEGPGFRLGDFELHPGVGAEVGYDSNLYYTEDSPTSGRARVDTAVLRITPHIMLSTLGEERRTEGANADEGNSSPPTVTFRGGLSAAYYEFFADSNRRNLELDATLRLNVLPERPFSFSVWDTFNRSIRPFTENSPASAARLSNQAGLDLNFQTTGGIFQVRLSYQFGLQFYEANDFQYGNSFAHDITLAETFRFLPSTAIVHETMVGYTDYYNFDRARAIANPALFPLNLSDSVRLRTRIGLNGALTENISLSAMIGYAAGFFFDNSATYAQEYDSVVAMVEGRWQVSPDVRLSLGYDRDFHAAFLGNYYSRDRGYATFQSLIGGAFMLAIDADVGYLDYGHHHRPRRLARRLECQPIRHPSERLALRRVPLHGLAGRERHRSLRRQLHRLPLHGGGCPLRGPRSVQPGRGLPRRPRLLLTRAPFGRCAEAFARSWAGPPGPAPLMHRDDAAAGFGQRTPSPLGPFVGPPSSIRGVRQTRVLWSGRLTGMGSAS
jgi:TonB family protein